MSLFFFRSIYALAPIPAAAAAATPAAIGITELPPLLAVFLGITAVDLGILLYFLLFPFTISSSEVATSSFGLRSSVSEVSLLEDETYPPLLVYPPPVVAVGVDVDVEARRLHGRLLFRHLPDLPRCRPIDFLEHPAEQLVVCKAVSFQKLHDRRVFCNQIMIKVSDSHTVHVF